jgi:hypothetical protein
MRQGAATSADAPGGTASGSSAAVTASTAPQAGTSSQANPLAARVAQLEHETVRLQRELEKAQIIIEVQKKVASLLGKDEPTGSAS